jgi:hypothetical protein
MPLSHILLSYFSFYSSWIFNHRGHANPSNLALRTTDSPLRSYSISYIPLGWAEQKNNLNFLRYLERKIGFRLDSIYADRLYQLDDLCLSICSNLGILDIVLADEPPWRSLLCPLREDGLCNSSVSRAVGFDAILGGLVYSR